MLRIAGTKPVFAARAGLRKAGLGQVRHNSHVAEGAAEPLGPYLKWTAGIVSIVGLIVYDRFYSDGAITKLVTPKNDAAAAAEAKEKFLEEMWRQQERSITLLAPPSANTAMENFRVNPVPEGAHRVAYTGGSLDTSSIPERRPRTVALAPKKD